MFALTKDIPSNAKLLWAHVLRRAVFDYVLYKGMGKKRMDWQRAYQYVFVPDQRFEDGFSFEEVCEMFGWDPDYLRRMTTKLTRSDIKRMETSSFKDELTQDVVALFVKKSGRWRTNKFALPFYPRLVDEFVYTPKTRTVRREVLSSPVPMVKWQATI